MAKFIFAATLLALVGLGQCGQRVDIILSARDVPKDDFWSQPDPYVKVFYKFDANQNWISYGQTTVSDHNPNPNWPQVFSFDFNGSNSQRVKYELWDQDVQFDDLVGTLELSLLDIVNAAKQQGGLAVERAFTPSGKGRIVMKVRIDGVIPPGQKSAHGHGPLAKLLLKAH